MMHDEILKLNKKIDYNEELIIIKKDNSDSTSEKAKKKEEINWKNKKAHDISLKHFTKQETVLLNFWWIFFHGIWTYIK